MLDRFDRGGFNSPSVPRERSIPRLVAPYPSSVRAWDVKVCLSLVSVVLIVVWVTVTGATPAALGGIAGLLVCATAGRSIVQYRRIQLR
ncbi:hypothetical protein ACIHCQ_35305 [Streptomyces sp. NPDC052236]|uniref:hypothetical protein n=1 Tax=Streptomyces sp. NPDC052236 TaxID=3365686 RepID=UPI0037D1A9C9